MLLWLKLEAVGPTVLGKVACLSDPEASARK
jgi:hypothetical protein